MATNFSWIIAIFLLLSFVDVQSQTIIGTIQNSEGNNINGAIIKFIDSISSNVPSEFSIARTGEFSHTLKNNYTDLYVEFSANGFKSQTIEIQNAIKDKIYKHTISLVKDDAINLKEVAVVAKRRAFTIKQDTVDYNVAAFRDGSERKIQDLIKKLPGIVVNEKSGEIRYKGKPIETVKLDGDDLFGSNYALATKNINIDMVEQVQAIENYSNNPLLKGVETGDKVALNLKLKKGKTDLSGTLDLGSGVFNDISDAHNLGVTAISVSKKFKSFSTLTFNNIGEVNSPYDYFTNHQSVSQLKESNRYAHIVITDDFLSSALDDSRSNSNNELFATYNAMFKVSKKFTVKANFYFLNDRMQSNQLNINRNFINGDSIITSDKFNGIKKPNLYSGDVEFKIHTSPSSLLEYNIATQQENVAITSNNIQNFDKIITTSLDSKNFFIKNDMLFTKKISENTALQAAANYSFNKTPQSLQLTPSFFTNANTDVQSAEFQKKYSSVYAALLGSGKRLKYNFTAGFNSDISPFSSNLAAQQANGIIYQSEFKNNIELATESFYLFSKADYSWRKFKISPFLRLLSLSQTLQNFNPNTTQKKSDVVLEPFIAISYKFNDKTALINSVSYNAKPFGEDYGYQNHVIVSSRNLRSNTPELALQKNFNARSSYMLNDLYNQFQLNIDFSYVKNMGNFYSNITIQEAQTRVNYFYLNEDSQVITSNFMIQKYFSIIESTLRFQTNLSTIEYKNIINQSDLRSNQVTSVNSELFFKSAFDIAFNIENVIKYSQHVSNAKGENKFENNALNNTFKIIFKPSRQLFFIATADYFIPTMQNKNQDYLFIDALAKYAPTDKRVTFSLIAKNLLKQNKYQETYVTDYSKSLFRSNLLQGYIMLNISYSL